MYSVKLIIYYIDTSWFRIIDLKVMFLANKIYVRGCFPLLCEVQKVNNLRQ